MRRLVYGLGRVDHAVAGLTLFRAIRSKQICRCPAGDSNVVLKRRAA